MDFASEDGEDAVEGLTEEEEQEKQELLDEVNPFSLLLFSYRLGGGYYKVDTDKE